MTEETNNKKNRCTGARISHPIFGPGTVLGRIWDCDKKAGFEHSHYSVRFDYAPVENGQREPRGYIRTVPAEEVRFA